MELSKKIGLHELNHVRYRMELGKEAYASGRLDMDMVEGLCDILEDFKRIMAEFGVSEYRACATSAFRELDNPIIVIEQIRSARLSGWRY